MIFLDCFHQILLLAELGTRFFRGSDPICIGLQTRDQAFIEVWIQGQFFLKCKKNLTHYYQGGLIRTRFLCFKFGFGSGKLNPVKTTDHTWNCSISFGEYRVA